MSPLPTPAEVAMQASVELLAIKLYEQERDETQLIKIDRAYRWIELTPQDRDEYRRLATDLLIAEHKQPWE